ncbi:MAG: TSUP family transporter [Pseudomonadota bacterium]
MSAPVLILLAVFGTSLISGVLGMAGGLILMALLVLLLSVPAAMMLHGLVQAFSNASRAWFLRAHIVWSVLPRYLVGAAFAVAAFAALAWLPPAWLVLLLIGLFPWLALLLPDNSPVVITNPRSQYACGALVTGAQLVAGASGPLLDLFYVNSTLDRHQIVATKGITQTIGHLAKLAFYGVVSLRMLQDAADASALSLEVPLWLLPAAVLASIGANWLGTRLLGRFSNDGFRRVSRGVILALGAVCVVNALRAATLD